MDELPLIAALIRGQRQAALGTLHAGAPYVSMVAYAPEPAFRAFLLHLSGLAPHTQHLLRDARASLLICEPDRAEVADVQTLARITLIGEASVVPKDSPAYAAGRATYLARLPAAAPLFAFADFDLFRFVPAQARYIGGFARARTLDYAQLQQAARS